MSHAEVLFCDLVRRGRWWVWHPIPLPPGAATGLPAPSTANTQSASPLMGLGTSSELTSLALTNLAGSIFSFRHLLKDQIFFSGPFPDCPILNRPLSHSPSLCLILFSCWRLTLFAIVLFIYFLLCLFSSLDYDLHKGGGYFCLHDHRSTWCMNQFSSVAQSCPTLSNPWTTACQASLSITNSQGSLKFMSIESVMPSSHLVLCHPLLLLPSIFPSIRVFSNESAVCIRWPKYWSFSLNISPSNEHPGLI